LVWLKLSRIKGKERKRVKSKEFKKKGKRKEYE